MSPQSSRAFAEASDSGFHREVVASFSSYAEAERAIESLATASVPAEKLRIIGHGLRIPRGQDGRSLRWMFEAGIVGAAIGAFIILLAVVLGLGDSVAGSLTFSALLLGAACGLLAGIGALVVARLQLPEGDIRLFAERYDVTADPKIADRAAREIESAAWLTRSSPAARTRASADVRHRRRSEP